MRLTTTLKSEASVTALANRLYADLTPESRKLAEAALIKANPQLSRGDALRAGMVVNTPDVPGLKLRPNAEVGKDPVKDVLGSLQDAVAEYRDHLATSLEAAQADLGRQEEVLKQKEVAAAIKATPDAAEAAKALTASLRESRKTIAADQKQQKDIFAQIGKDLDSLIS